MCRRSRHGFRVKAAANLRAAFGCRSEACDSGSFDCGGLDGVSDHVNPQKFKHRRESLYSALLASIIAWPCNRTDEQGPVDHSTVVILAISPCLISCGDKQCNRV